MTLDIRKMQAAMAVPVDGVAGPQTFTALFQRAGATTDRAQEMAIAAARWFGDYGLMDSGLRLAHFLAQQIHESGTYRYMEELASGAAYEGRMDLGNSQPGDGVRFKGRGPFQLTGRANYRRFGARIGIDLERHPEIAAFASIGQHVACEYWKDRGLNALADADDLVAITRKINGGLNGLDQRKAILAKVKGWLL